jgi:mono/diheme cytochrome c family protein
MKKRLAFGLALTFAVFALGFALASPAGAADGKAIFEAQKCNTCHGVSTAGIAATTTSEKMKGPDLVGGVSDAAWTKQYIKKEVANKADKKHMKEFKGTPEELDAIVAWLQAQKK